MYENHRDNFGRSRNEDDRRDREQRWRQNEERYRRESMDRNRFEDDRYDQRSEDYGHGAGREEDFAGYGAGQSGYGYGSERQGMRGFQRQQQDHSGHDQPYRRTTEFGGTGDSSYFTGQQGSWAVAPVSRGTAYGYGGGYGDDYREHGYGSRSGDQRGFLDRAGDEIASWFGDESAARRREQDHRGRGPKGYVRSDERIREDVHDRLTDDSRLDAENVTVTVESGEVTLNGTVPDRNSKRRAEDLIEDISGVKHVQNNLRVAETGQSTGQTGVASTTSTTPANTSASNPAISMKSTENA